jgi:hypothetical protein
MKLKKKDLLKLVRNHGDQAIINLQLSGCSKDLTLIEQKIINKELEIEKFKREITIKREEYRTLTKKSSNKKEEGRNIVLEIKNEYKLEEFGYDPDTGEIK